MWTSSYFPDRYWNPRYWTKEAILETSFSMNTKGGRGDNVSKAGRADVSKGGDDDDVNKGGGIG